MNLRTGLLAAWALGLATSAACGGSVAPGSSPQLDGGGEASAGDGSAEGGRDVTQPDTSSGDDASPGDAADSGQVDTGVADTFVAPDAPFVEATHGGPVITNNGGPTIAHPLVVTITYADDTNRTVDEQIGAFLPKSKWIATVGAEYGVGNGTSADVELTQNAPASIDDTAIQSFIASLITAGTAPDPLEEAGAPEGGTAWSNAVYMIYFPPTTSVTLFGQGLCQYSAGGYHYESSVMANGHTFAYAVISPCPGGLPVSPPEDLVWTASHELIEACTDPFVVSAPGYDLYDTTHPWSDIGGEVGDLCTYVMPQWPEGPYTSIQRVYSNQSAMAGGPPCIPSPEPYYGADGEPSTFVAVPAGGQTTFKVTGWSTAPVPAWSLSTYPYPIQSTIMPSVLSLGASTLQNGQTTTLTVGMPSGAPSGTYVAVFIQSYQSSTDYTTSVVGVYVP